MKERLNPVNQHAFLISYLNDHVRDLVGIYLFGSRPAGQARPDSDLDVALLTRFPEPGPSAVERFDLAGELENQLGCTVDLLNLRELPTDVRFQVVSTGERIYCDDETICDTFDMLAFSMYQRLEEERKDIIEAVKKRGNIYG